MKGHRIAYPKHPDGRTTIHKGAHNSWRAMMNRCYGKKYWARANYAGKGIKVCERWRGAEGFSNFLADMGDRPEGCSLDRINNDGNYCPANCRWVGQKEQVANSSKVLNATISKADLAKSRVSMAVVYERLHKGWSKNDALYTPPHQWKEAKLYGPCPICGKTWKRKNTKYCSKKCYMVTISGRRRNDHGCFMKGGGI